MTLRKIYLTQSRKDAKEIANIIIYLGALASLRENKEFLFRSDWTLAAGGGADMRICLAYGYCELVRPRRICKVGFVI